MAKYRICVGVAQPEETDYRFDNSFWDLLLTSAKQLDANNQPIMEISRTKAIGSVIARNRNLLVESAKAWGATHLLQIDADQAFPSNALSRLLSHDKDVVCATTCRRAGEDRSPVAEPVDRKSLKPFQKLVPMKLVGFPFMLVKMGVFDKLREPYFADPPRWMVEPENQVATDLVQEDEFFCKNLINAGYEILCDMELSMEIGHIGKTVFYIQKLK